MVAAGMPCSLAIRISTALTLPSLMIVMGRKKSSQGDISAVVLPALVARTCHALRQATKERDCIDIVRAWELGFIDRDEILALTGLDEAAYRRARGRLFYLAGDLPDELRQLVRDYIRSA